MQNKVEIIIDDFRADLKSGSEAGISINKSVSDIVNLSKRSGSFTYTISLPKTKTNRRIFQHADQIDKRNIFARNKPMVGQIRLNDILVFKGSVRLISTSESDFKINITGNDISWTDLIKDKKLTDLNLDTVPFIGATDLYPTFSPANSVGQDNIWTGTNETYDIQFPIVSYGNFFLNSFRTTGGTVHTTPVVLDTKYPHKLIDGQKIEVNLNTKGSGFIWNSITLSTGGTFYSKVIDDRRIELYDEPTLVTGTTWPTNVLSALTSGVISAFQPDDKNAIVELNFDDIPPSFYLINLFKKIFSDIGYDVSGSFFTDAELGDLLINYTGKQDPAWNWGTLARALYSANTQFSYDNAGAGGIQVISKYPVSYENHWIVNNNSIGYDFTENYDTPDFEYICPVDGLYKFKIRFSGHSTQNAIAGASMSSARELPLYLARFNNNFNDEKTIISNIGKYIDSTNSIINDDNVIVYFSMNNNFDTATGGTPTSGSFLAPRSNDTPSLTGLCTYGGNFGTNGFVSGTTDLTIETPYTQLNRNDNVRFQFGMFRYIGTVLQQMNIDTVSHIEVSFSGDTELHPEKSLPEIKQLDFIKSVIAMFNLYLTVDDDLKTVFVEKRDNYFQENIHALDWSDKIVESTYTLTPIGVPKDRIFQYKVDNNDFYKNTFLPLIIKNEDIRATGTDTIEAKEFAATVDREYLAVSGNNLTIPTLGSEEQINTDQREVFWEWNYVPRVLKWEGLQDGFWIHDDKKMGTYPYATFENSSGLTLTWDVNQGNEGLYLTNYLETVKLADTSAIVTLRVNLNQNDVNNLDFRTPVRIGLNLFYVNKIKNYRPAEIGPTEVEFIKIT